MNATCRTLIIAFVCALLPATPAQNIGNVFGWGDNGSGQLNVPPSLTDAIAISAGNRHNLAVRANGTVVAWGGDNSSGELSVPPGLNGVMAVAAGSYHSLALRSNGTVVAWGLSDAGQTNVPPGLTGIRAIAAGEYHSVALRNNGTVAAWGNNAYRQTSVPGNLSGVVAIACGLNHTLALRNNGTVIAWGESSYGETNVPVPLTGVVGIAAGNDHSLALRSDGSIVGWGNNFYQQLTIPAAAVGAKAIFAGNHHSGALKPNGMVVCWGDNSFGQTVVPATLSNVVQVASHGEHSIAIYLDPIVITAPPASQSVVAGSNVSFSVSVSGSPPFTYQWRKDGSNVGGATNSTYALSAVQRAQAGAYSVRIANGVGSLVSASATLTVHLPPSISQQPQNLTVAAGSSAALTVIAAGDTPLHYHWQKDGVEIANDASSLFINGAQSADSGSYSVIVSNAFGTASSDLATVTVYAVPTILEEPQNQAALLGSSVTLRTVVTNATGIQWLKDGTNIDGATGPFYAINQLQAGDLGSYRAMAWNTFATTYTAFAAITMEPPANFESVVSWGQSSSAADFTAPAGLGDGLVVSVGHSHTLVARSDGSVVGWGDNAYGQAGLPPGLRASVLAAGGSHTLVIANGRVGAFGFNGYEQVSVPMLSNVVGVAAGESHSMALLSNGMVRVWGDNTAGQQFVPGNLTNAVAVAAGFEHCLALRRNGTVIGWGGNSFGQARAPFAVTNGSAAVAAIAAGGFHSMALKSNGTVVVWGKNNYGQTFVPADATNIVAVAAGLEHCLALRRDGRVIAWGRDNEGQTEVPGDLVAFAIAAGDHRSVALRREPFVFAPPRRLAAGQLRVSFRNASGRAVDPARLGKISVHASADIASDPGQWVKLASPLEILDGSVVFEDATGQPSRFYIVTEDP